MSQAQWHNELRIPAALALQLRAFRRRVWSIKLVEAVAIAIMSVLIAFLIVFVLDRLFDTSAWLRAAIGLAAVVGICALPWFLHRWVWRFRRLDQLARLLSRKMPRIGDQLLGIIELAENRWEQHRSRALCQAAIEQVSDDAQRYDFRDATPDSRLRTSLSCAGGLLLIVGLLVELAPAAAGNAFVRLARPWGTTPRYTFAALEPLPSELVVAHGEPFHVSAKLADGSLWQPEHATARLGSQQLMSAELKDGGYSFDFPAQIETGNLHLRVGDATFNIEIQPKLRPELTSIAAKLSLPDYLGKPGTEDRDARGGSVALVKGSRVSFAPTANRPLESAQSNGKACVPTGASFRTPELLVNDSQRVELQWKDKFGLSAKEPFSIAVAAQDDEPPQLSCEDLPRGRVVLDREQLVFHVRARDDFGVKDIGMSWRGIPTGMVEKPAKGETMLGVGGHDKSTLDVQGTFTAKSLGIEPQPIEVRIFATDYFPNRKRVYTAPYLLYVLNAEQHAIWITEQLAKWHRQSLEVRDRELQLYETNKRLRAMSPQELDRPETRRQIERQADAEQTNGRRLANLTEVGKDLLKQAARNPEIAVDHLDKWAEMLQILMDISANRMPSVANLLKGASKAPRVAASSRPANNSPSVGQVRNESSAKSGGKDSKLAANNYAVPRVVDTESSQEPQNKLDGSPKKNGKPSTPTLRLPATTLSGKSKPTNAANQPASTSMDQAVTQQRDLLTEFEKVADELNQVLANMEGSTLVKRLKAASRQQYKIAGRITDRIGEMFGNPVAASPSIDMSNQPDDGGLTPFGQDVAKTVQQAEKDAAPPQSVTELYSTLSHQEEDSVEKISYIMDDMAAYFDRRRLVRFKVVLDDMRKQDVLGGLRQLSDDISREQGLSIAQCEYWSDTMDRWAEDLIDPACSGECSGCRSKGSLPPAIVLEVLQVLEGEMNLREETRVAEQAKAAVEAKKHAAEAHRLSESQHVLQDRIVKVVERIRQLPNGDAEFPKEIALLRQVSGVMKEATGILASPETGPPAIAAETEAIEL
ncbi:MAG TPA: hypothetical protein VFW73_00320, partial [Lacipirellulaceae bacterium]|nr:hypothetical protein [Lacipirellulaceae bacterium]